MSKHWKGLKIPCFEVIMQKQVVNMETVKEP